VRHAAAVERRAAARRPTTRGTTTRGTTTRGTSTGATAGREDAAVFTDWREALTTGDDDEAEEERAHGRGA
jgi:hypothetical protein